MAQPNLDLVYTSEFDAYSRFKRDSFNSARGSLTGHNCSSCNNKGFVMYLSHLHGYVYEVMRKCECTSTRSSLDAIDKSGLKQLMQKCTFETFQTPQEWQVHAKKQALQYLADYQNNWFYMGGQVGCGKTHLCTAIVGELLKQGLQAKYMMWRDETVALKSDIMDKEYQTSMKTLKTVPVLYIDDFFKTEMKKAPSTAEINIAFELLNYRYNNPGLSTIISSEKTIDELLRIDQGVGSRIFQRTKSYCVNITADVNKNYRLAGG